MNKTDWPYEDIVDLPHHVSKSHAPMPMIKRAAQFAPFAALSGYDDAVAETARLTDTMAFLPDDVVAELNRKITEALERQAVVAITYFIPDEKKAGGRYAVAEGRIKKADMGEIVLENGLKIEMERVVQADV